MCQGPPKNEELARHLASSVSLTCPDEDLHYTLYVFPFSLYSIMVRFTISLGSHYHRGPGGLPNITHKLVNLHRDENLEEWYLTTVNPKGQVPAMFGQRSDQPFIAKVTESLKISNLFCSLYFPGMMPDEHRATIEDLLDKLHAIQAFSLTVKDPAEEYKVEIRDQKLDELLKSKDISETYRRALEYKEIYYKRTLAYALRPENIAKAKSQANELFQQLLVIYDKHHSPGNDNAGQWLFGASTGPTVLDAHATAFIARLDDAGWQDLVPGALLSYAREKLELPSWKDVCHGRKTIWNISYGHVDLLGDF
ncbi:hypothetical protein VM1G_10280 [Cytospora mali]|uniref:GST N-terminal domain-containing protein n=1 Tax=Cytospora mali TaxID=578113 RepID=A0A194VHI9_CYTMA|nr:hypothetical protein VM1G_10280 [Valsa mali]